jgi:hypothetical protein
MQTIPSIIVQPTLLPVRTLIYIAEFVDVRFEPGLIDEPVFDDGDGPGGRKKPKKIGTRKVYSANAGFVITVATRQRVQTFLYGPNQRQNAEILYQQIARLALQGQSGVATDYVAPQPEQTPASKSEPEQPEDEGVDVSDLDGPFIDKTNGDEYWTDSNGDKVYLDEHGVRHKSPQGATDGEGFERDPEYIDCMFQCSNPNCEHVYKFEVSDLDIKIPCPECETENAVACTFEEYQAALAEEEQAKKPATKKPAKKSSLEDLM